MIKARSYFLKLGVRNTSVSLSYFLQLGFRTTSSAYCRLDQVWSVLFMVEDSGVASLHMGISKTGGGGPK